MRVRRWMMAAAAVALALPVQAQDPRYGSTAQQPAPQAVSDPLKVIYRVPGVRDTAGIATVFSCTSNSSVEELLKSTVRKDDGSEAGFAQIPIPARSTRVVATRDTNAFTESASGFATDLQGIATISASTTNVFCSAMLVDPTPTTPNGIALHMVRFNPHPGTEE